MLVFFPRECLGHWPIFEVIESTNQFAFSVVHPKTKGTVNNLLVGNKIVEHSLRCITGKSFFVPFKGRLWTYNRCCVLDSLDFKWSFYISSTKLFCLSIADFLFSLWGNKTQFSQELAFHHSAEWNIPTIHLWNVHARFCYWGCKLPCRFCDWWWL